jgi:hypothetical protein
MLCLSAPAGCALEGVQYEQRFRRVDPSAFTGVGHVVLALWLAALLAALWFMLRAADRRKTLFCLVLIAACSVIFVGAHAFASWFPKAF